MPKTLQEILDHADDMSATFDDFPPDPASLRDPAPMLRARSAVHARAQAEADVAAAVTDMRSAGYSWVAIGMVLGTSGEAARQRYGEASAESRPARSATRAAAPAAGTRGATPSISKRKGKASKAVTGALRRSTPSGSPPA